MDILVGEARNKIAEALEIIPASRLLIESGKGRYIEDLSKKLFNSNDNSSIDFFGFITCTCFISIGNTNTNTNTNTTIITNTNAVNFTDTNPITNKQQTLSHQQKMKKG